MEVQFAGRTCNAQLSNRVREDSEIEPEVEVKILLVA